MVKEKKIILTAGITRIGITSVFSGFPADKNAVSCFIPGTFITNILIEILCIAAECRRRKKSHCFAKKVLYCIDTIFIDLQRLLKPKTVSFLLGQVVTSADYLIDDI